MADVVEHKPPFLQRMGAPTAEALSAGAVDDISETVVQVLIVVALLPLVDIDLDASELAGGASPGQLVLTIPRSVPPSRTSGPWPARGASG